MRTRLLMSTLFAAAIAGISAPAAHASAPTTTITLLGAETTSTFAPVIQAFERRYPTIKVKYDPVPFADLNTDIAARIGGHDRSVDVYEVDEPRVPSYALRRWLVNLNDLGGQLKAAVVPQAVQAVSWNHAVWALPIWTSDQLLYYNKKQLAAAHIPFPSADPSRRLTWEQVVADGKKVQKRGVRYGFTFEQLNAYYQLQVLPASLGGGSGLTGAGLLTPDITNAAWVKAMDWYQALFTHNVSMREVSYNSSAFFANGELPYFVGGPWDLAAFDAVKGLRYGVAPQPYFAGGKVVTPTDSEAIGINPASTKQAAARTFIAFMCLTAQGANAASINDPLPPVQKGALRLFEQRLMAQGHGDAVAIMRYDIAHTAIHRPRTVAYVDFESIMDNAFTDIKDGAPVAARLQQASQQLTRAFQKYQGS